MVVLAFYISDKYLYLNVTADRGSRNTLISLANSSLNSFLHPYKLQLSPPKDGDVSTCKFNWYQVQHKIYIIVHVSKSSIGNTCSLSAAKNTSSASQIIANNLHIKNTWKKWRQPCTTRRIVRIRYVFHEFTTITFVSHLML